MSGLLITFISNHRINPCSEGYPPVGLVLPRHLLLKAVDGTVQNQIPAPIAEVSHIDSMDILEALQLQDRGYRKVDQRLVRIDGLALDFCVDGSAVCLNSATLHCASRNADMDLGWTKNPLFPEAPTINPCFFAGSFQSHVGELFPFGARLNNQALVIPFAGLFAPSI